MQRPLWQILLAILVLGFVVQRAGAAAFLHLSQGPPLLIGGFALQIAAGLATALGLWLGRHWVVAAIALLGISVVATALLGVSLGVLPAPIAVSQSLVAALSTGALVLVLRRAFGGVRDAGGREDRASTAGTSYTRRSTP